MRLLALFLRLKFMQYSLKHVFKKDKLYSNNADKEEENEAYRRTSVAHGGAAIH